MSEIEEYRSQIRTIEEQLELTEDETERAELIQVKQDLEELVGLLLEGGEEEVRRFIAFWKERYFIHLSDILNDFAHF